MTFMQYAVIGGIVAVLSELFLQRLAEFMMGQGMKTISTEDYRSYSAIVKPNRTSVPLLMLRLTTKTVIWPIEVAIAPVMIVMYVIQRRKKEK